MFFKHVNSKESIFDCVVFFSNFFCTRFVSVLVFVARVFQEALTATPHFMASQETLAATPHLIPAYTICIYMYLSANLFARIF